MQQDQAAAFAGLQGLVQNGEMLKGLPVYSKPVRKDRKRCVAWSEEEHRNFLVGMDVLGVGNWKGISQVYVPTRSAPQIASHAQKYFMRVGDKGKKRARPSLFDLDMHHLDEIVKAKQAALAARAAQDPLGDPHAHVRAAAAAARHALTKTDLDSGSGAAAAGGAEGEACDPASLKAQTQARIRELQAQLDRIQSQASRLEAAQTAPGAPAPDAPLAAPFNPMMQVMARASQLQMQAEETRRVLNTINTAGQGLGQRASEPAPLAGGTTDTKSGSGSPTSVSIPLSAAPALNSEERGAHGAQAKRARLADTDSGPGTAGVAVAIGPGLAFVAPPAALAPAPATGGGMQPLHNLQMLQAQSRAAAAAAQAVQQQTQAAQQQQMNQNQINMQAMHNMLSQAQANQINNARVQAQAHAHAQVQAQAHVARQLQYQALGQGLVQTQSHSHLQPGPTQFLPSLGLPQGNPQPGSFMPGSRPQGMESMGYAGLIGAGGGMGNMSGGGYYNVNGGGMNFNTQLQGMTTQAGPPPTQQGPAQYLQPQMGFHPQYPQGGIYLSVPQAAPSNGQSQARPQVQPMAFGQGHGGQVFV